MIPGEGVSLRVPTREDLPRWFELLHDPDELRFGLPTFVPLPESLDAMEGRVAEAAEKYAAGEPGSLTIVDPGRPDHFLGIIAWRLDSHPGLLVSDVGYGVHADSRGRGVARRALAALSRWLMTDEGGPHLARVQLDHSVENIASCKVALGAGFAREGVRRGFLPLRDPDAPDGVRRHDVCLHGLLPSDPPVAP